MNNCKFMQNLNFFKNLGFDTDKFVEVKTDGFYWCERLLTVVKITDDFDFQPSHTYYELEFEQITDELIERLNLKKIIAFKPIESTTEIYYTIIE